MQKKHLAMSRKDVFAAIEKFHHLNKTKGDEDEAGPSKKKRSEARKTPVFVVREPPPPPPPLIALTDEGVCKEDFEEETAKTTIDRLLTIADGKCEQEEEDDYNNEEYSQAMY